MVRKLKIRRHTSLLGNESRAMLSSPDLTLEFISHPLDVAPEWDAIAQTGVCSLYQTRSFVSAWLDVFTSGGAHASAIVGLRREGKLVCIVPLVLRRRHGLRIAEFAGGSHSNHNLPLFLPQYLPLLTPEVMGEALQAVGKQYRIDAFELHRQPLVWNDVVNPLVRVSTCVPSSTIAQDVFLHEGFEALLKRHNGSTKVKKTRAKERILAAAGGYRIIWAKTPELRRDLIAVLFAQKSAQFAGKGIHDAFADAATRRFFDLLADGGEGPGAIELAALEAGGSIRAVRAYGIHQSRLSLMVQSYAEDDLSRASPGEVLLFRSLEDFCQRGFAHVDFGVGRERYKDSWADAEIELADNFIGLSSAGRFYMTAARLRFSLERRIRNDKRLWPAFKSARRIVKGQRFQEKASEALK